MDASDKLSKVKLISDFMYVKLQTKSSHLFGPCIYLFIPTICTIYTNFRENLKCNSCTKCNTSRTNNYY